MASIRGRVVDPAGAVIGGASVSLLRPQTAELVMSAHADRSGDFVLPDVPAGRYIVLTWSAGFRQRADGAAVDSRSALELSTIKLPLGLITGDIVCAIPCEIPPPSPVSVLTVCEALDQRDALNYRPAVIVGVYKSGLDETLRLDCPFELTSGEIGWPASIGLTHTALAPDRFREQVEKKRQQILASAPPEAPLRPERVVGFYGSFVSLAGLSKSKCCNSTVETVYPPARLFGFGETDLRVIR